MWLRFWQMGDSLTTVLGFTLVVMAVIAGYVVVAAKNAHRDAKDTQKER